MKIDRLIGILSVLLQKGSVTAPELAEMFEVSRRTINRDIEDLCMAGIPVATRQGSGGGISILDGYTLQDCPDKTSVCKTGADGTLKNGNERYLSGAPQFRQRTWHKPIRSADGKAFSGIFRFSAGGPVDTD